MKLMTEGQIEAAYAHLSGNAPSEGGDNGEAMSKDETAARVFCDFHLKIHRIAKALKVIG